MHSPSIRREIRMPASATPISSLLVAVPGAERRRIVAQGAAEGETLGRWPERFEPQRGEGLSAASSVAPAGLLLFLDLHPGFRSAASTCGWPSVTRASTPCGRGWWSRRARLRLVERACSHPRLRPAINRLAEPVRPARRQSLGSVGYVGHGHQAILSNFPADDRR